MKLEALLSVFFCDRYGIDGNQEAQVNQINPWSLVVSDRLDLIAKIKYLEFKNKGFDMSFIKDVYQKQLEAITNGTCIERGNEAKNGLQSYLDVFNEIEESILNHSFNENLTVVPVGKNNAIMDGAHRTAICAYHNIPLPVVYLNELEAKNNASFFLDRFMDPNIIDYLVTEYCKTKNDIFSACIWPRADSQELRIKAEELISSTAKVVHKKELKLTEDGLRNLMIQIYSRHDWMGNAASHFSGATTKSSECYKSDNTMIVYIIEGISLEEVLELKRKVREIFKVGNHSIHITDNKTETIQIANLLLNNNSVHLLNFGKPDYYVELNLLIESFKNKILNLGLSLDDFIVDSSGVLGLYGLREVNDLDYLTLYEKPIQFNGKIDDHNEYIKYHNVSLDSLLYNPNNYLVYNEVKFLTLERARIFKRNRGEKKDFEDIRLIDSVGLNKFDLRGYLFKTKIKTRRKIRNFKSKTRSNIMKTPFYGVLRNVKHFFVKR